MLKGKLSRPASNAALLFALTFLTCLSTLPARAFDTTAPTAILVDVQTGNVLFQKNADEEIPPASLAKLMTVTVLFDAIRDGAISKDTTFQVSRNAWERGGASSGGSTMFLPPRSSVTVGDLLKGIIVQSGNDATIVAAEGLSGSTDAFAKRMNREAATIGLTSSYFANPSGLPDPAMHVTMRDLARLAVYIIRNFPEDYKTFGDESFTYNKITQRNRNPLLRFGADGLKTGHTSQAGYGLVASAAKNGRRIVLAMSGMASAAEREREGRRLMDFGLQDFETVTLVRKDEAFGTAPVRGGTASTVPLVSPGELTMLVPSGSLDGVKREVSDNGPVRAPVEKGQRLGWVVLKRGDEVLNRLPLVAADGVAAAGLVGRIGSTIADNLTWK